MAETNQSSQKKDYSLWGYVAAMVAVASAAFIAWGATRPRELPKNQATIPNQSLRLPKMIKDMKVGETASTSYGNMEVDNQHKGWLDEEGELYDGYDLKITRRADGFEVVNQQSYHTWEPSRNLTPEEELESGRLPVMSFKNQPRRY